MKRILKELKGYTLQAKDGTKGTVKDFLFDEESWTIRYLEVDLGKILPGRRVLVPRVFLGEPDWLKGHFPVHLTKEAIENCPPLMEHLPVSRKYEMELNRHYEVADYWPSAHVPPFASPGMLKPVFPVHVTTDVVKTNIDTSLRSFKEVKGYKVECLDKKHGHVDDFIIDDASWQINYIVVDIGHWYSRSKKVVFAVSWMNKIDFENQKIEINQESDALDNAPEFDPGQPINVEYEKQVYDYYGRQVSHV